MYNRNIVADQRDAVLTALHCNRLQCGDNGVKKTIVAVSVLMLCIDVHALKPADTFGTKLVPVIE